MPFLAYFFALLIAATGLALGLDVLTRPSTQREPTIHSVGNRAPNPIRQIPIGRTTATNDDRVRPVYPPRPGGDVAAENSTNPKTEAPTETSTAAQPETRGQGGADKPQRAETAKAEPPRPEAPQPEPAAKPETAMAEPTIMPPAAAPASQPAASQAPPSCNVAACASAYRSFRDSDCTYQPYDGPRRLCEKTSEPQQTVATSPRLRRSRTSAHSRRDELDDVAREVRQLTDREMIGGDVRRRGVVILEAPYDVEEAVPRPPWPITGR